MANNGGQIRFGVGFDVDQSGLNKVKSSIEAITKMSLAKLQLIDPTKTKEDLKEIQQSAQQLQTALQKSFNTNLGTLNVSKFNQELKNINLAKVQQDFAKLGSSGVKTFNDMAKSALTTNMQLKQTNNILDKMGTTMMNTVKWGITSSIMNSFTGAVQEAFGYVKALDSSLTNIRIVTGQSQEEMRAFAVEANNAAAALGRQTKEYTSAALTYYQQGLNDKDVKARTEATLKAANITGESTEKMAEYLTSVWNGFQISNENAEDAVSKLAAVADSSASDMAELATGMSKVASTANSMGVSIDQLSAQIATIIATTRQAPESVGNALKTVYARIADIKAGTDDAEVSLGRYSEKMAGLGINVLDSAGELRDLGEVFEEIGGKWEGFNREQQIYLAQVMGGQRQYNQLISLFDNWTKYSDMLNISLNSQGAIDEKNAVYMESLEAHTKQLKAAQEDLMDSLINSDSWKSFIDFGTKAINVLADFVDGIGGGGTALAALGTTLSRVFSKQIGTEIASWVTNLQNMNYNAVQKQAEPELLTQFQGIDQSSQTYNTLLQMKEKIVALNKVATAEEQNTANEIIKQTYELGVQRDILDKNIQKAKDYYEFLTGEKVQGEDNKNLQYDKKYLENEEAQIKAWQKNIEDYQKSVKSTESAILKMKEAQLQFGDASRQAYNSEDSVITKTILMQENTESAKGIFDELTNSQRLNQEQTEQLSVAYNNFLNASRTDDYTAIKEASQELFSLLEDRLGELEIRVQSTSQTLETAGQKTTDALSKIENEVAAYDTNVSQINTRQLVTGVVTLASSMGQLVTAGTSLSNMFKTLGDSSATADKKIQAVASTLTMSIPMLISAGTGIKTAILDIGHAIVGAEATASAAISSALSWLLPIAGIIAGISIAIAEGVKYWNRYKNALENAKKSAETLKEEIGKLNSELSSLESAIDKYKDAKKSIDDLVVGTKEWKDAVRSTKDELLSLLSTYPQLSSAIEKVGNGLELNEEKYEAFLEQQQKILSNTQNLQLAAQISVNNADNENNITNVSRDLGIPRSLLEKIIDEVNKSGKEILYNNEITGENNESLSNAREKILDLVDSINKNSESTDSLTAVMIDSKLTGNEIYNTSDYQIELGNLLGQEIEQYQKEMHDIIDQRGSLINAVQDDNFPVLKELIDKIPEMYGDLLEGSTFDIESGYFKDESGKNIANLWDLLDEILATLKSEDFLENIEETNKQVEQVLSSYQESSRNALDTFNGASGDLSSLTNKEANSLLQQLQNEDTDTLNQIANLYGFTFEKYGEQAGKKFIQAFQNAIVDNAIASLEIIKNAPEEVADILRQFTDQVSPQDLKNISEVFTTGIERGVSSVDIGKVIQSIPTDKLGAASEVLSNSLANLGNEGSFEELSNALKEVGISVNFMDESWQNILKDSGAWGGFIDNLSDHVESLDNVITKVASGDKMNKKELEQYQDDVQFIIDQMGDLETLAPELQHDVDIITDEYLQGSVKWMDALKRVREEAEMATVSLRAEDLKDAFDDFSKIVERENEGTSRETIDVKINLDDKEFDEKLQSYFDASYELDVEIRADISSDLKDMGDMRDQISQLENLAGAGKVAFSEIEGLYSDLIAVSDDAVEILSDGSVKVSDTAIAEAKRRKEEELKASEETTRGEIENQMTRIQAIIEANNAAIEAAQTYQKKLQQQRDMEQASVPEEVKQAYRDQAEAAKTAYEQAANNAIEAARVEEDANNVKIQSSDNVTTAELENATAIADANANMCSNIAENTAKMAESVIKNWDAMSTAQQAYVNGTGPSGATATAAGAMTSISPTEQATHDVTEYASEIAAGVFEEVDLSSIEGLNDAIAQLGNEIGSYQLENDRYEGELGALAKMLSELNSGNYANNAGEYPKADKSGKGGGGGKGGSGSKEKEAKTEEPKHIDPFEDSDLKGTKALFRTIDAELEQIGYHLEKIQRQQSHLLGSALVNNLNKQLKVLKQQKKLYQDKLNLAKQEHGMLQGQLAAMGATFGKDGVITNATAMLQMQANEINNLINLYNGMDAAAQKAFETQINAAKQSYNNTKDLISQYEELNNTIPQIKSQIDQITEQQIQTRIDKFNAVIDLHIRWQDWTTKLNDFQKDIEEFNAKHATIYINTKTGEKVESLSSSQVAKEVSEAQKKANQEANKAESSLRQDYNNELKMLKTKQDRKQLSQIYGINLNKKKNRKAWKTERANQLESDISSIRSAAGTLGTDLSDVWSTMYKSPQNTQAYNTMLAKQAQAREEAAAARQAAIEQRDVDKAQVKGKSKKAKAIKQAINDTYFEALEDINNVELKKLQDAVNEFYDSVKEGADETVKGIHDIFGTFQNQMDNIKKIMDDLTGANVSVGGKRTSIIDESIGHALDIADRMNNMMIGSKRDKYNNVIIDSDKLKVGDTNPLTGEKITNKKQLKQAKSDMKKSGLSSGEIYGKWMDAIVEDAEKYAQQLMDFDTQLRESAEAAYQVYYDAIDKTIEVADKIIDEFDFINDMYETQIKLAKALNQSEESIAEIEKTKLQNKKTEVDFYGQQARKYKDLMDGEEQYSEAWYKYHDAYQKYIKSYYESQLDYIEDLKDTAEEALNDIIDKFDKLSTGNLGIAELNDRWEESKELSSMYLNNIDKAFAIQQLQAKYQQLINEQNDPARQAEIRDVMEQQIKLLEDAEYLSQAEVDNANALYDVTVKQIALEEAQRNKSKMRLRRDSQGNYTYQFVSDASDIKNKQQDLANSLQALNNSSTKALEENYNTQTKLFQDYINKLKEIEKAYLENELTEAEYEERLRTTQADFEKKNEINTTQNARLGEAYQGSAALSMYGLANIAGGTDSLLELMGTTGEDTNEIKSALDDLMRLSGGRSLVSLLGNTNLTDLFTQANENNNSILTNQGNMFGLMENLPQDMVNNFETIQQLSQDTINELIEEGKNRKTEIDTQTTAILTSLGTEGGVSIEEAIESSTEIIEGLNDQLSDGQNGLPGLKATAEDIAEKVNYWGSIINTALGGLNGAIEDMESEAYTTDETGPKTTDSGILTKGMVGTIKQTDTGSNDITVYKWNSTKKKMEKRGADSNIDKRITEAIANNEKVQILATKTYNKKKYVKIGIWNGNEFADTKTWIPASRLTGYDTGGYTGDWAGTDGKLAILHKKEQVLNQDDTQKMLDAVKIANNVMDIVAQFGAAAIKTSSGTFGSNLALGNGTLDQNVSIQASFPNVSDHNEIEQALNNLINRASQYANPNRRLY